MVYTVLARKYRPQKLSDLVGQETLVKVLSNSFRLNRIAHAFILTGSRGVGKTSTARIIAKALNCEVIGKNDSPTTDPCGKCSSCVSITESRHIDVIEMDAASRTGVSDVRDIIENVDYKTVSARYKIYIIDEVHMLSNSAFNALLKTLEEPPRHVKFIFATTEINKIPTTVISRCQRFDLNRIENSMISSHLEKICNQEGVSFSLSALSLISNSAGGSLRDALSILDQAIVHGEGTIKPESIRDMLGIVNQNSSLKLLEYILDQKPQKVLEELEKQYSNSLDPVEILNGLMEIISQIMIFKIKKENTLYDISSKEGIKLLMGMSERLSNDILSRFWQMTLKVHEELKCAPDMFVALQMGMLRLSFFSNLPGPSDLMEKISLTKSNEENLKRDTLDELKHLQDFPDGFPESTSPNSTHEIRNENNTSNEKIYSGFVKNNHINLEQKKK